MDSTRWLLAFDEIRSRAAAACLERAEILRACDPDDPNIQELIYQATRVEGRIFMRETDLWHFMVDRPRRLADDCREMAAQARTAGRSDAEVACHLADAEHLAAIAAKREQRWKAQYHAYVDREQTYAQIIADAARGYAEQLSVADAHDPRLEDLIYHANRIEQVAAQLDAADQPPQLAS